MCWFHKWETIDKRKGNLIGGYMFSKTRHKIPVVAKKERCTKCGKIRFRAIELDGTSHDMNPDFFDDWKDE